MRVRPERDVVFFVGPTLARSARSSDLLHGFRRRPPIKRGDVERLVVERRTAGVLVVVDGLFHDTLAVGHAELREAIERGWRVWGLSSMGAIRAREMKDLGMRGFGRVYARFVAEPDFQDDEVALLHEASPPYRAVTDPLVHVRAAVDCAAERGIVRPEEGRAVIDQLKARWYGDRTMREAIEMLGKRAEGGADGVRRGLGDMRQFELKTVDLEAFVDERAWLAKETLELSSAGKD